MQTPRFRVFGFWLFSRSYHDPDETLDEMREREMKKRLNGEFKRFVQQVEEVSKVEFDLPYR